HAHDPRPQRRSRATQSGPDLLPLAACPRDPDRAGLAASHGSRTHRARAPVRDRAAPEAVDGPVDPQGRRARHGLTRARQAESAALHRGGRPISFCQPPRARQTRTCITSRSRFAGRASRGSQGLPGDLPLLARVDLLRLTRLEQERFHVRGQEVTGRLVAHVQAIVVDQHGLEAQPFVPADAADRGMDPLAQLVPEGRLSKLLGRAAAPYTLDLCHCSPRGFRVAAVYPSAGGWFWREPLTQKGSPFDDPLAFTGAAAASPWSPA